MKKRSLFVLTFLLILSMSTLALAGTEEEACRDAAAGNFEKAKVAAKDRLHEKYDQCMDFRDNPGRDADRLEGCLTKATARYAAALDRAQKEYQSDLSNCSSMVP
jgi:hypothetical protein